MASRKRAEARPVSRQLVIENPVINSPFEEPCRHFRFSEQGITNEIVEGRRPSSYFIPIPRPKGHKGETPDLFDTGWTEDRIQLNPFINKIWGRVALWRKGGYSGVTRMTARLHSALGYLRPVDVYRGDPKALQESRRRKLAAARHRRREANLRLRQLTLPLREEKPVA
jgi:hypothetical protein